MKHIITLLLAFFISAPTFACGGCDEHNTDNLIPRKVLLGNPDKIGVTISHDGKYISYIAPYEGVLNVWVAPIDKPLEAHAITRDKGRGITDYGWAYDNKHIIFGQDHNGNENDRLYSYDIETKKTKLLTPAKGVKAGINGMSEHFPNEILISTNERNKKYFDLYRLNLTTSAKKLVFENNKYSGFITDDNLKVRFAIFMNEAGDREYYQMKDDKCELFTIVPSGDIVSTNMVGFDKTGNVLYMIDSRNRNTAALTSTDLRTAKTKIIAKDKKSDIGIAAMHPTEKTIQMISTEYEKVSYKILDSAIKADIKYLRSVSKGDLSISARTLNDKTWLVSYMSDDAPIKFYKYDRVNKKAEFLFVHRKALLDYKLAEMTPVIIKARDGLNLVSYLTYPTNVKEHKNLPMVVVVHGGPFGIRDSWGYDREHQLLANRGYAVLSVNYRGSGGFGKDFVNAGTKQWGLKMHDDILDAVNWAVKKKIADPKRVAIMGGSYGGYETLIGMTFSPDVFACGVDVVGPSNLMTLIKSFPEYWKSEINFFKYRVGDFTTPEGIEAMKKVSPINYADNIKKPLYIAQGGHDPRVTQIEADQIVNAMHKHNIPVMYALYPDEGHGFAEPHNSISHYALTEQFLSKILGGRAEPIGNSMKGANLILDGKRMHNAKDAEDAVKKAVGM